MRRASQNVEVFCEGRNALLSFGYDYCAEHEWGIDGIRRSFGISGDLGDLTIGRYAVTRAGEENVRLVEADAKSAFSKGTHKRLYLIGGDIFLGKQTLEEFATKQFDSLPLPDKPEALWCERDFMYSIPAGFGREKTFRAIHAALMEKDALIYTAGGGNPFGGSGLVIARRSTIPAEISAKMEAGFRDKKELREASDATGIKARVEAWGRANGRYGAAFFALSPAWLKGFKTKDGPRVSAYPVMYWLNPYDQQNNNFGWFTVEELEQWMEGKGPIPKKVAA